MNQRHAQETVKIESIFHPSDFSAASEIAFVHALKIALVTQARLSILHATASSKVDWQEFPGVRETLERWKLIPKGSSRSAVGQLGVEIRKVMTSGKSPVKACLHYLAHHPADLIVLAVRQQEGRMGWLERSVGKPIARKAGQVTLFLPHGVEGFVSREDGSVALRSILIPVALKPHPQPAMEAAVRLICNFQLSAGAVTLLHVGPASGARFVKFPQTPGWSWKCVARPGEPAETILQTAAELAADLILMTTDGPDGFLDGLRGTTSERVLGKARCAVGNLPAGSLLG